MNRYAFLKSAGILVLPFLALSACNKPQASDSTVKALTGGTFEIKARDSGKCLDVAAASTADGALVQQAECTHNLAQRFKLNDAGNGFVSIVNVGSNRSLDAMEKGTADGTQIQQWGYAGTDNQQWRLEPRDAGSYVIIGRASGRAVEVDAWSKINGAKVQLWKDNNTPNQQWFLIAASGDGGAPPPANPGTQQNPPPANPGTQQNPPPANPGTQNPPPANGDVIVKVTNQCPFNIWVHAAGAQGTLQPDDAQLSPNATRTYSAPGLWQSARVEAYVAGPRQDQLDKVEMTFDKTPTGQQALNFNVTYVDWVGLPVKVSSIGTGGDCKASGCNRPVAQLLDGCPADLKEGRKCLSERTFCLNPVNAGKAICTKFDSKIAECVSKFGDCKGAAGSKTPDVQACSGAFFSQNPKYCAAINRGMLDDATNANIGAYYKNGPFNEYSKWVHEVCPSIYALAYDDFPPAANESGYHSCTDGHELDVTFCPGG